ncbi:MAG: HEAT repeat domain-containing protein [Candidatus Riflebacteria bacterium]|nr:HEAT repeat domain-containing protein [Candidatus Riflebacteria bacterium]
MEDLEILLESNKDRDRMLGIAELAKTPSQESFAQVQIIADNDESPEVRFYARKALQVFRSALQANSNEENEAVEIDLDKAKKYLEGNVKQKLALIRFVLDKNLVQVVPLLLSQLKNESDPIVISAILKTIGKIQGEAAISTIFPYLRSPNSRVRADAIEALDITGSSKTYPSIIMLLNDPDNRVRATAVIVTKNLPRANALGILKNMIYSGQPGMQASAAFALKNFPDQDTAALLETLLTHPDPSVRQNARKSLLVIAQKGISRAREIVEKEEITDPDETKTQTNLEEQFVLVDQIKAQLVEKLKATDPRKRIQAINEGITHGGTEIGQILTDHLKQEKDLKVLASLIIAFGKLQAKGALPFLLKCLDNRDNRFRANAVEAIWLINDKAAIRQLVPLLKDPNNRVKANAIIALKNERDIDLKAPLLEMVQSNEELNQRSAIYAICELKEGQYWPFLKQLANSPFSVVVQKACNKIAELEKTEIFGTPSETQKKLCPKCQTEMMPGDNQWVCVECATVIAFSPDSEQLQHIPLSDTLNSSKKENLPETLNGSESNFSAKSLKTFSEKTSFNSLREMSGVMPSFPSSELGQRNYFERLKIIDELRKHGEPAEKALCQTFQKSDFATKVGILQALGGFSSPFSGQILLEALRDPNPEIQIKALDALGERVVDSSAELLTKLLSDSSETIRWFAVHALGKQKADLALVPLKKMVKDDPNSIIRNKAKLVLLDEYCWNTDVEDKFGAEICSKICELKRLRRLGSSDAELAISKELSALGKSAIEAIELALSDEDPDFREILVGALGCSENELAFLPLAFSLLDPNPKVRSRTICALGDLKDPRACDLLQDIVSRDEDPENQSKAREILQNVFNLIVKEQVDPFKRLQSLGDQKGLSTFNSASLALFDTDGSFTLALFWEISEELRKLQNSRSMKSPDFAIENLKKYGRFAVFPLIAALKHNSKKIREAAIHLLAEIGDRRAIRPLKDMSGEHKNEVESAVVYGLGILKAKDVFENIVLTLQTRKERWAINALGNLQDWRAFEVFISLLADPNWENRDNLIHYLGVLGDPRAIDTFICSLKDPDPLVRSSSVWALGNLKVKRAIPGITDSLTDSDKLVRGHAARALSIFQEIQPPEKLVELLKDKDTWVRLKAAVALADLKDPRGIPVLIEFLGRDYMEEEFMEARQCLTSLDETRILDPLILSLQASDAYFSRKYAVEILGNLGNVKAVQPLIEILDDMDEEVRIKVMVALGKLKAKEVVQRLREIARKETNENLKKTAREILLKDFGIKNPDSSCFIATACFGIDSYEVRVLRNFRDEFLEGTFLGTLFCRTYYLCAPLVCIILEWFPRFKSPIKTALSIIVAWLSDRKTNKANGRQF